MRVKMKQSVPGSPDGKVTRRYEAGTEHELGATPREIDLAKVFVREGWAEEVTEEAPAGDPPADPGSDAGKKAGRGKGK